MRLRMLAFSLLLVTITLSRVQSAPSSQNSCLSAWNHWKSQKFEKEFSRVAQILDRASACGREFNAAAKGSDKEEAIGKLNEAYTALESGERQIFELKRYLSNQSENRSAFKDIFRKFTDDAGCQQRVRYVLDQAGENLDQLEGTVSTDRSLLRVAYQDACADKDCSGPINPVQWKRMDAKILFNDDISVAVMPLETPRWITYQEGTKAGARCEVPKTGSQS